MSIVVIDKLKDLRRNTERADHHIIDAAIASIVDLRERVDEIHSCHHKCQKPLCVAQRRIVVLEGELERLHLWIAPQLERLGFSNEQRESLRFILKYVSENAGQLHREAAETLEVLLIEPATTNFCPCCSGTYPGHLGYEEERWHKKWCAREHDIREKCNCGFVSKERP